MPLSWNEIRDRAVAFSREWKDATSERAEAQSFWNDFFQVFGLTRRRVAVFEKQVSIARAGSRLRDGRIDAFWKGVLLIEHKSAQADLDRAFAQAADYFEGLPEKDLPRYILVSDFQRFRLFDLEAGKEWEFRLGEFQKHIKRFAFIAGYQPQEIREQDPVNVRAAERMGRLHDRLKASGYTGHALEVYLVRLLFCLFADDTGIFSRDAFRYYIENRTSDDGRDLGMHLHQFFQVLNTPEERRQKTLDEDLAGFPYVNGRLFEEALPVASFDTAMREALADCADLDWSKISPAVFGALFQSVMDEKARRNLGAHYTSETNILKLIKPLFLDALWEEFGRIRNNKNRLFEFHKRLRSLTFLDPACGCGNFLVIAYRELRLLELEVLRTVHGGPGSQFMDVHQQIQLDVDQFYGIEMEEFPAQIAQVALWLMDHQMNVKVAEEFGMYFARIPLKTSPHVVHDNALRIDWNVVVPRERLSYIMGNPPFIGHHLQTVAQKAEMLNAYGQHSKSAGVMDYVTAWYCKAAPFIQGTRIKVGFVSTNSITQGEQVGILWRALEKYGLHIHFAHRTFRWTSEARGKAAVYCVIIGFAAYEPESARLFEYEDVEGDPHEAVVSRVNAYLVDGPWVLLENRSRNCCGMPEMMYGSKPTDDGNYLFTDEEKADFLRAEPGANKYIKPFISAHEYLHGERRWALWLVGASPSDIVTLPNVLKRVQAVDQFRKASKAASTRSYPYPTLFRQVTQPTDNYVLIPGHTSENRAFIPFGFFDKDHIVGNSCFAIPGATLYHFGILQSTQHMAWVRYTCGRLESRYRYSKDIVYNNYPWPRAPSEKQVKAIEEAAQGVLDARDKFPQSSLADLYDPLTMPPELTRAHQALDRAVDAAYGRKAFSGDAERVAFLFELYQQYTSLLPVADAKPKRRRTKA